MNNYFALRKLKSQVQNSFTSGDVLVLFGELFNRGYANGLVEEAQKRGMKIITTTVGRREKDNSLRKLNPDEITSNYHAFINVPLEAGFDLEPDDLGKSPVDYLKDVKLSDWESFELPAGSLEVSRAKGRERFTNNVRKYLAELETHIPSGANVLFAHLMAGGVPRAKLVMPIMNRVVKGTGERFLSSKKVTESEIGKLLLANFNEVTAETFSILVNESQALRNKIENSGKKVSYVAYGYHGTEILINNQFLWQSYSPYIQGWAKLRLESFSRDFSKKGIQTCVYNCPEILTNSSSIFSGVELSLYPLLQAIQNSNPNSKLIQQCKSLLKDDVSLEKMLAHINTYLKSDLIRRHCVFEEWPQHNSQEQLEFMLNASDELVAFHKDTKQLITYILSEVVFEACGKIMMTDAYSPESPVSWINHDIIASLS